jgi:ABC-2 type transport system permease protein
MKSSSQKFLKVMNKISLIIAREYLTRVQKKSFIMATLLGPILMGGIMFLPTYFALNTKGNQSFQVIDESGLMGEVFTSDNEINFEYISIDLEEAKSDLLKNDIDGLIYIPDFDLNEPKGFTLFGASNQSMSILMSIENALELHIESLRLLASGLNQEVIDSFDVNINLNTINLNYAGEEKKSSSGAATIIGYLASFMIYMFVFFYGAMCMRGIIEEKSNRIVEIVLSSVKPFELMMGKVIGIAMVGLTQFLLWVVLTFGIFVSISVFLSPAIQDLGVVNTEISSKTDIISITLNGLVGMNMTLVLSAFLFYFIGGYLLYGALFAAIGSASESDADAQQFMLPVTAPLIISIISLSLVLQDPHGSISFWMSIIPFTSPVIMMMRIPFGVEIWELILSVFMLITGFLFTLWIAGRIYRVGILMHGAKVNWKILVKWLMTKD